jgi:hypothetical protein
LKQAAATHLVNTFHPITLGLKTMLTPQDIKVQLKAINAEAIRLGGTKEGRERVTVRIDKSNNTAVFLYTDDAATGAIPASFWDCGALQYGEISLDWYRTHTLSPLTNTIDSAARATFAASLQETVAQIDQNYVNGNHSEYARFVPQLSVKLPTKK